MKPQQSHRKMASIETVRKVQIATFAIAQELADNKSFVSFGNQHFKSPFSLRIKKKYRTPEQQAFRNQVAQEAKRRKSETEKT